MESFKLFIGGEWVDTGRELVVVNKYTGEPYATISEAGEKEVQAAVAVARRAFRENTQSPAQRAAILLRAAALIGEQVEDLALTIATEGGKPLKEARAEAGRAVNTFTLAAEEAKRIHGEMVPVESVAGLENRLAFTLRVPLGVVAAISPFNFPLNLVAHKVAPAIAAGNTVVLKPASTTPITAAKLCRILEAAGLPAGHLNLVVGSGNTVGEALLAHPDIAFFTFTGSEGVGKRIKEGSGLRRCSLELGSNSAVIVHRDAADPERAGTVCARQGFANAGQVCISVQRVFVHEDLYDQVRDAMVATAGRLVVGDPRQPDTDVGPMISEREAVRAEQWVNEAVAAGARLLTGGRREGAIYQPTILEEVPHGIKIDCQEVFAPIISLFRYRDLDDAIGRVNASRFGLQAGIFTTSIAAAMQAARTVEVGGVIINDGSSFRADLMPYGGVKNSGIGREGPRYAIEEMTDLKIVVWKVPG